MTFGEKVKYYRKLKNMTQQELADALHVGKQAINKYEKDVVTNLPIYRLKDLARVLDVDPNELAGLSEPSTPEPTLTPTQQRAVDLIKTMSDDDLRKFISMGEILKGGE